MNKIILTYGALSLFCVFGFLSSSANAEVTNPCPDSIQALSATPDDLSKVQADIDRFTLCVERAQLLRRLNDLALENQGDLENLPLIDAGIQVPAIHIVDSPINFPPIDGSAPDEIPDAQEWTILSIFGSGMDLSAKIINSQGHLAQIKKGDSLPDGFNIADVSKTTVTLKDDKEKIVLKWLDDQLSEE